MKRHAGFSKQVTTAVNRLVWLNGTWGGLEALAGVTDRLAFWRGRTEDSAHASLLALIAARVAAGELPMDGNYIVPSAPTVPVVSTDLGTTSTDAPARAPAPAPKTRKPR